MINFVYSLSCKSFTIPFYWTNGSISLKQNQNIVYNYITWFLLLSCLVLRTFMMFEEGDINKLILNGIFLMFIVINICFQLTILLYQTELVQLINQTLHMNSCWGTLRILTLFKLRPAFFQLLEYGKQYFI